MNINEIVERNRRLLETISCLRKDLQYEKGINRQLIEENENLKRVNKDLEKALWKLGEEKSFLIINQKDES